MNKLERQSFIQFLLICSTEQITYILKTLTTNQLQVILEILYNVIKGVCPISKKNKTALMQRKRLIREVLRPDLTLNQRRRQLQKLKKELPIFLEACIHYGSRVNVSSKTKISTID